MVIETDPCKYCDFTQSTCGCDIELCMISEKNRADYGINPNNPLHHDDDELRKFAKAQGTW